MRTLKLFVVATKSGTVVSEGHSSKMDAKAVRTQLHAKDGIVEADIKDWSKEAKYVIGLDEDHDLFKGKRVKHAAVR